MKCSLAVVARRDDQCHSRKQGEIVEGLVLGRCAIVRVIVPTKAVVDGDRLAELGRLGDHPGPCVDRIRTAEAVLDDDEISLWCGAKVATGRACHVGTVTVGVRLCAGRRVSGNRTVDLRGRALDPIGIRAYPSGPRNRSRA